MSSRRTGLILALIFALFAVGEYAAAEENYCKDPASWVEWENLLQEHPGDMDIQALHALRLGLCIKVERGDLSLRQASRIFERAREAIVQSRQATKGEPRSPKL